MTTELEEKIAGLIREHCGIGYSFKDGHIDIDTLHLAPYGAAHMIAHALAAQQDGALTANDLNLVRQWYNAVCDANPEYLDDADKALGKKITERVRRDEQSVRE